MTEEKTLAGAGFLDAGQRRRDRRTRRKQTSGILAAARREVMTERRAALDADREERKQHAYLPANGEPGPAALRSRRRLRVQPHRATSEVLAGAYPFLAEAGLGEAGVFIGQDGWSGGGFCFDPWVLYQQRVITNPNVLLAGVIGKGKSTLAKALAVRSIAFGRRVYVPGDPKGEWTIVAETIGGSAVRLGPGTGHRLNPLDNGPRPASVCDAEWIELVASRRRGLLAALAESALGRPMTAVEHTALDLALHRTVHRAIATGEPPTLPRVLDALFHPDTDDPRTGATRTELAADGRQVGHALRRLVAGDLAGLFDGPSTIRFDPALPMVTLDLSAISGSDQLIALVMTCASAWMEAALADPAGGQRWVIYDEAWRLVKHPALLARMQAHWKLSRTLGLANLAIIHRLSDLDAVGDTHSESRALAQGLLADCSTKVIYQQETSEAPNTAAVLGLSVTEQHELPTLQRGEGLWRIGERAFVVRHLCTPNELQLYNTNARMDAEVSEFPISQGNFAGAQG
jgi:hypothetical protein